MDPNKTRLLKSSNISHFSPSAVLEMILYTVILLLSTCPIPCLNHLLLGDKVRTVFPVSVVVLNCKSRADEQYCRCSKMDLFQLHVGVDTRFLVLLVPKGHQLTFV